MMSMMMMGMMMMEMLWMMIKMLASFFGHFIELVVLYFGPSLLLPA